ncbi:MAG: phage tail tape measure protein [Planctomycetota bacterium]|nr:MAG: phage tail tape measure protein [Planctomycetota bacterium]
MPDSIGLGIIIRLKDEATRGVRAALGGIERLGDEADKTHKRVAKLESGFRQLRDAGLGLTVMGAAAAGALYSVVKPAAALQEQVKNALTLTGETGDAFARMERDMTKRALELSTVLGISAADVAESFYQVLSSGAEALSPQFDALTVTALKMAKTVGLAPADAVEILSDTLHAFEMDVSKAERAADVFFATSKLTATTVPQLTEAMREAGPAAASVGYSLEATSAVLAGFAAKGVKGAKAGTAFRMILTRLAKPPGDAAKALRFLGVSVYDASGTMRPMIDILKDMQKGMSRLTGAQKAAALKAIAGEEAFSKLGGLLEGNLDTLESWRQELTKSGAMELAFSQKMGAASEQVKVLWISIKNLAISIGHPLLESLSGAASWLGKVMQKFAGFAKAHPILGKVVGVTLAVVGVFGLLAGSVLMVTGMMGLFALKWIPLVKVGMSTLSGVVTRAIPTFIGWGKALIASARTGKLHALMTMNVGRALKVAAGATWGAVKAAVAWTASTVKNIAVKAAHVVSIVAGTVATWAGIVASKAAAVAQWLWNAAMTANPIGLIIAGVAALVGGIVLLVKNWDAVTGAVKGAFKWFKNLLGKAPDWLLAIIFPFGLIIKHFDKVKAVALSVFGAIKKAVSSVVGWIVSKWGTIKKVLLIALGPIGLIIAYFGKIKAAIGSVVTWVASKWGAIKDILLAPVELVMKGWTAVKDALLGVFTAVADTVSGVFGAVRKSISGVIDYIWGKITWVISKIPDVFLPESLEKIKYARKAQEKGAPVGGQIMVAATASATERAVARPRVPRDAGELPAYAMAAAPSASSSQSVVIQSGAIQIHAVRVDENVVRRIDYELAKLIRRRQERR